MSVSSWRRLETDKADIRNPREASPFLVCPSRAKTKPALSEFATMFGLGVASLGFLSACSGGGGGSAHSGGIRNLGTQTPATSPSSVVPNAGAVTPAFDPIGTFSGEAPTVIDTIVVAWTDADEAEYEWFVDGVSTGVRENRYQLSADDEGRVLSLEISYTVNGEVRSSTLEKQIGRLVEGQAFTGDVEVVSKNSKFDIFATAQAGDFIAEGADDIAILNIESRSDVSHDEETEAVFKAYAPQDLHDEYRTIYNPDPQATISNAEISGPTIIVVPSDAAYNFDNIIAGHGDDVVILLAAGNDGEPAPLRSDTEHYQQHLGNNIFFVGGYDYSDNNVLATQSAQPDSYNYSFLSGQYSVAIGDKEFSGTSFAVQEVAAKLAVLYEALNENSVWSLKDAMALLMTSRSAGSFAPDLNAFLVKDAGNVYVDDFGKTHLLPDDDLRAMINAPIDYANGGVLPSYHFNVFTTSFTPTDDTPAPDTTQDNTLSFDDFLNTNPDLLI